MKLTTKWQARLGWAMVAVCALWLLWMTLRPQAQVSSQLTYITAPARAHGVSVRFLIDFLGNIAVFVPLGAAAAFALPPRPLKTRLTTATAIGAGLSAAIELAQHFVPGRDSSLNDWLLNTLGALIGAAIAVILTGRRKTHDFTAKCAEVAEK
ncbi:MAG TPA: VanZ family protein [Anaerolineae bacterium]|nr:VanZ family protein [Anaerolineae bacterium]